jgi:dephospho-CoA kinase
MVIGLTGGYGAGKNAVAELLEKRGWSCVDADALGHEAVDMARDEIVRRFGAAALGPDGRVDRRELARIVFADPEALADQEAIIHPIAIRLMKARIAAAEAEARAAGEEPLVCVNAALLHRAGIIADLDAIIEVRAPLLLRALRGMRRDGTSALQVLRRIARQRGFRRALRAAAGRARISVIHNSRDRAALERALERALDRSLAALSST